MMDGAEVRGAIVAARHGSVTLRAFGPAVAPAQ
jgi:hypothetical protein